MQPPLAQVAEPLHNLGRILLRQLSRRVSQVLQTRLQLRPGELAVAVVLGRTLQERLPHPVQLSLHLAISGEVQLLELVNELHQPVERLLMHTRLPI